MHALFIVSAVSFTKYVLKEAQQAPQCQCESRSTGSSRERRGEERIVLPQAVAGVWGRGREGGWKEGRNKEGRRRIRCKVQRCRWRSRRLCAFSGKPPIRYGARTDGALVREKFCSTIFHPPPPPPSNQNNELTMKRRPSLLLLPLRYAQPVVVFIR